MPTLDRIAKTISGPNEATHVGREKLVELQDIKWGRLKAQDQAHLLRAAKFIQRLFDQEAGPDGWVITSGDDTKARMHEYNDLSGSFVTWTKDLDKALWFARREDAEQFARDDDDAWHIRRVSEVHRMWGPAPRSEGVPATGTGVPHATGGNRGAIVNDPAAPVPIPPLLPVCQLSDNDLLRLFRAFVTLNVTQWAMGAGDHHHPIWAALSEAIEGEDATFGPDWAFVQPLNRERHAVLLVQYIDQQNAHEAEERGG